MRFRSRSISPRPSASSSFLSMAIAGIGRHYPARQGQGKGLLALGQLQYPIAEQRQACLDVPRQRLEIQPGVASAECREVLDQQPLAP